MMDVEGLKLYLPKYLSPESQKKLFEDLKAFPENIDTRLFTSKLTEEPTIFQGDGLEDLLMINLPDRQIGAAKGMVLSNTCDIDQENERFFPSRICYAPIFSLEKYRFGLLDEGIYSESQIDSHILDIKKQRISQIFYLPKISEDLQESIVFFDRMINCDNNSISRSDLSQNRIFTLSDYGLYLFLFKLSIHFTRIQEGVERGVVSAPS